LRPNFELLPGESAIGIRTISMRKIPRFCICLLTSLDR
jgi:hypothetical protein